MSIAARGSVHATTRRSPGASPRKALRTLSAGRGHLSPRRFKRISDIAGACPMPEGWTRPAPPPKSARPERRSVEMRGVAVPQASPLTSLADTIARLLRDVPPAGPRRIPLRSAEGRILAAALATSAAVPPRSVALRDGWAAASGDFVGASPYSPVFPVRPLPWITIGDELPPGTDCVLAPEAASDGDGPVEI